MKRDKLYTIPKNFGMRGNLFWNGGIPINFNDLAVPQTPSFLSTKLNVKSPSMVTPKTGGIGAGGAAALSAAGGIGNQLSSKLISDGYDAHGIGSGIANVGNTVGGIVGQFNPVAGAIVQVGSGIIGGLTNRAFGTKENETNVNALKQNVTDARLAGSGLAGASTSGSLIDAAGQMTTSSGFGTTDLVKGGWFAKGKARRKGQRYINKENAALAYQNHGLMTGAGRVDSLMDDIAIANTAAFGGMFMNPIQTGALGIMQQDKYINAINNRTDAIAKTQNLNSGSSFSPLGNAFADGGGIHIKPSHRGLFTEKANRAGMGVQAYASHVLANKEDYPTSTIRQANFAKNSSGWRHDGGGDLKTAFMDDFMHDPIGAVARYNQGLEAEAARKAAAEEAFEQQMAAEEAAKNRAILETQLQNNRMALQQQAEYLNSLQTAKTLDEIKPVWTQEYSGAPSDTAVMARMRRSLLDRGVTNRAHQDAIIANMMVESSGNPNAKNKNSSARGLMQWLTPRHPKAWDWDSQVDHIVNTYNKLGGDNWLDKAAYAKFQNTTDSAEAARLFRRYWERPEASTWNATDKWISQMYNKKKAFGGELGTNGTDFTNGLLEINVGGAHEENPYEGVQLGVDPNGIPNLVEEGETVYNNYVFSKRMNVPEFMGTQLGLGGAAKRGITFADASKKIAQASVERPNSPMDREYINDALGRLAQAQEAERMRMMAEQQNEMAEMAGVLPPEAMGIEAAYGGKLGNKFEGPRNKPNLMVPENLRGSYNDTLQWLLENNLLTPESDLQKEARKITSAQGNQAYRKDIDSWLKETFPSFRTDVRNKVAEMMMEKAATNMSGRYESPERAFSRIVPTMNFSKDNYAKYIRGMMDRGIDFENAYALAGAYSGKREPKTVQQRRAAAQFDASIREMFKGSTPKSTSKANAQEVASTQQNTANRNSENTGTTTTAGAGESRNTRSTRGTGAVRAAGNSAPVMNDSGIINPGEIIEGGTWNIGDLNWLNNPQYQAGNAGIPYSRIASEDDIRNIEQSKEYQNWTNYVLDNWDNENVQNYLKALDARAGGNHLFGDDISREEARTYFRDARSDGKWGYYHLTPGMQGAQAAAENGNTGSTEAPAVAQVAPAGNIPGGREIHMVEGEEDELGNPSRWEGVGAETRRVQDPDEYDKDGNLIRRGDIRVYHANADGYNGVDAYNSNAPKTAFTEEELQGLGAAIDNSGTEGTGDGENVKPKQYDTWMRYAPAVGAGIMTLTDLLGLTNKPDYTYAKKIEGLADRFGYAPNVNYTPIGNYIKYQPMDIWAEQNRLNANARATDRAIQNNSGPLGTQIAGLVANNYNNQIGSGNLYRQALEYNDAKRQQVADFNRRTDMFNSQMGLEADTANARYTQMARHAQLSGLAQAAAIRDAIDQRIGAARSANITNLLTSLGNIGRENFALNQINSDPSRNYGVYRNGVSYHKSKEKKACGGKMKK